MTDLPNPPVAATRPYSFERHGVTIDDPWNWLRDPGYPNVTSEEVLTYLKEENAYYEAVMKPLKPLADTLFAEMRGRIKEDDATVPQKDGDWLYWTDFEQGGEYRRWWRKPVAGGEDTLILDEPALAKGKEYFRLGGFSVSNNGRWLAYAYDDNGSERFLVRVKDLETGEHLPDEIPGMLSDIVWTADDAGFLYGLANDQWRTDNARYHRLGSDPAEDVELYHEEDEGYRVGVGETQSRKWIVISTGDHVTSEVRLLPANDPFATSILVAPRQEGREYDVEEHDGTLFIHTNDTHTNFRLCTASIDAPGEWVERIAPSPHFYMTGVTTFADFFVVEGREDGLDQIELHQYSGGEGKRIAFPEASYVASLGDNPEYAMDVLRIGYESMVTPGTVYDYHVATGELEVRKVQIIPSGYDASKYATERLKITARDGTEVPCSIVYPRDFPRDGSGKVYLYAYGAYGIAIPPGFSTSRMSFLDRGVAFAIAHIRGGDDLGQQWYLDGKLKKRTNTFNDFVDVAKGLIDRGFTHKGGLAIAGGSAGGELMGAVINSDPDLWGAVVADVPFVDVLNTMLDDTLPLTPGEWPEWGNPITDAEAFELIRGYSPYDNVRPQAYPPIFISGGLNDPRVTYWEPAKWAAKLRATKTDDNILLLKTNMGAGHGGKSGRWESLHEAAEENAFVLWQLGLSEVE
ncbi:S9 family peptidase [Sphingomonas koreensis]|jgi:oligopeptidase B|uniref:S9 family peptidase n=1 Tax=Sphingomonas koreensis TaxID=93064 RepID=A0A1L6J7L9_9SPHN|nr:S9 family peptidase [Sphingomonas koreensis]APR51952.1 S9 family peptidase [Sphingomonas koreensis]MDC7812426.1 S9 family peptidase [Sphingomonas koreensis]RSU22754.1 S9 family peptidase [Sphingomonas koreensis]RSU30771.1 S9 family peptidase [Sphingomonas koreensis]RSU31866.1 S9 family peptidase [Sphingomonas koreensis]